MPVVIHALAGLPRSGSTLVANILNQHPDVHVTGTSPLFDAIDAVAGALSRAPETRGDLVNVPDSYDRYLGAVRALGDAWWGDRPEPHVVDKSRGWLMQPLLLRQLWPDSALIVCVRDPRDVVASIERQHRRTALFRSPLARTLAETVEVLMRPDGMVGGACRFVEDLLRRKIDVVWVRYESFVVDPSPTLAAINRALGVDPFRYDVENVENVATDLDAFTLHKFPHDAAGAVRPTGRDWRDVLPEGSLRRSRRRILSTCTPSRTELGRCRDANRPCRNWLPICRRTLRPASRNSLSG